MNKTKLKTVALPYQQDAYNKLKNLKVGGLLMDRGTGKTRTIFEIFADKHNKNKIDKLFYIAPTSVIDEIKSEVIKHFVNPNIPIHFYAYQSISQSDATYLKLYNKINKKSMLVLDESHYIKNYCSKRANRLLAISKKVVYKFIMTGTEVSKNLADLYAQFYFLDKRILGYNSFYSFSGNHLEYSKYNPEIIVGNRNYDYIARKIQPYIYQVKKEDCLELPKQEFHIRSFSLSLKTKEAYALKQEHWLDKIVDEETAPAILIFAMFTELQQICSVNKERVEALKHELLEMSGRIIVFTRFINGVNLIAENLSLLNKKVFCYNGTKSVSKRRAELDAWSASSDGILIVTFGTGAHGLNLAARSNYIIFFDQPFFDYSMRLQAIDRIYRLGQKKICHYTDIISNAGIEKHIDKSLDRKESVSVKFAEAVKHIKNDKSLDRRKELRNLWEKYF